MISHIKIGRRDVSVDQAGYVVATGTTLLP